MLLYLGWVLLSTMLWPGAWRRLQRGCVASLCSI